MNHQIYDIAPRMRTSNRFHTRVLLALVLIFQHFVALGIENEPPKTQSISVTSPDASLLNKKKSRWTIFIDAGGGLLIADAQNAERNLVTTVQDSIVGTVGVGFFLLDGCQRRTAAQLDACSDVLIRAHFGGSYAFMSKVPTFVSLLGIEGDWYLGHQRYVALTSKIDGGVSHLFLRENDPSVLKEFRLDPQGRSDTFVFSAGLGILLNFGAFKQEIGFALSLDTSFYFDGGYFGFLVSPGLRYRF